MTRLDDAMDCASAALRVGDIVVVRCRCGPTIGAARDASRRMSARLSSLAAFGAGRLVRSASPGMGLVAAHLKYPLGIDVEALTGTSLPFDRRATLHSSEEQVFPAPVSERDLSAIWVRKEAVLKAFGVGLAVMPSTIATGGHDESWQTVSHAVLGTAWLRSLDPISGFEMGLAALTANPASVSFVDCAAP
jgi:hypothetical protein